MDAPRGFGLWHLLGGAGLFGGVAALLAVGLNKGPSSDAGAPTVSVCEAPRHHDCTFYASCLESNVSCGPSGYALGFGDKYCRRFQAAPLSPPGAAWADSVMLCLERSLLPYDKPDRKSASCDEISEAAFAAHSACYTALPASICFLPPGDVLTVFDTIGADEVFAARTRAQIQAVILTCTEQVADRAVSVATRAPEAVDTLDIPTSRVAGAGRGGFGAAAELWEHLAVDYQVPPPGTRDAGPPRTPR